MSQREPVPDQSGVREDGGYVGKCTGCHRWYWNSWGAGTYCPSCLHGYCDTIKGHWDDAERRFEAVLELARHRGVDEDAISAALDESELSKENRDA